MVWVRRSLLGLAAVVYMTIKYTPVIARHFQAQPVFLPLKVSPIELGETVEFPSTDGLRLAGSYFRSRTGEQAGVIVYCHEYLSDRWSFRPYIDGLRDIGFDIFTFDFRNHGSSATEADYAPIQWATDREVRDLKGALRYLRTRADRDPAGLGVFGVSRGGTTALLAAADEPDVWAVVTDGAFPTSGTMLPYILRWAEIYVQHPIVRSGGADLGLSTPGMVGPAADRAGDELPVPQRRTGGCANFAATLAFGPWPGRYLYQSRDRDGALSSRQGPQRSLAGCRGQAQSVFRARSGPLCGADQRLLRAGCSAPTGASRRHGQGGRSRRRGHQWLLRSPRGRRAGPGNCVPRSELTWQSVIECRRCSRSYRSS